MSVKISPFPCEDLFSVVAGPNAICPGEYIQYEVLYQNKLPIDSETIISSLLPPHTYFPIGACASISLNQVEGQVVNTGSSRLPVFAIQDQIPAASILKLTFKAKTSHPQGFLRSRVKIRFHQLARYESDEGVLVMDQ